MVSQELIARYRIISLASSGFLVLWYFFDVNISKIDFLKDLEFKNQQIISYILVIIIIFCTVESLIEYSKNKNKSWQSKLQLLIIVIFPVISLIISYPKLITSTLIQNTNRLDIIIPILTSFFTSIIALQLNLYINSVLVFYKFRKTILPNQIVSLVFLSALLILGIASINLFSGQHATNYFPLRYLIFTVSFLISFLTLVPKKKIFSEEDLDLLAKKSASLDRQVEISEYVSTLRKPISHPKKKIYKKIKKTIRREEEELRKSVFPRFIMLVNISFKEGEKHSLPISEGVKDDDPVLRVNILKKDTEEIVETNDIKFKYVKMACKKLPKLTHGNDIRSFLTPMASKAYSIQLFHESDPNELLLNFANSDENICYLKELLNNRDPDINHVGENGWTALLVSVANGEEKTVKYLLQRAADPNISTKHGATPLHFASKYGNFYLCKLLLDYHADINKRDIDGSTPLMMSGRFGHSAIVKLLIQYGADSELIDNKQKTALDYAIEGKYGEICKQLRKKS